MICELVFLEFLENKNTENRINIHDFPTPEFPINSTLNK